MAGSASWFPRMTDRFSGGTGRSVMGSRWPVWVGCCRMGFPIAVIDFDAVMTGTSRPSTDLHQFPVNDR